MPPRPSFEEFARLASGYSAVPVSRQLIADDLTPVSAYARVREDSGAFLFESVVGAERVGRYSFLGARPFAQIDAHGTDVRTKLAGGEWEYSSHPDPLRLVREWTDRYRAPHLSYLPRFSGGAVGYAGYDTVRYAEHLPNAPHDDRQLPDLSFAFYDRMVIFDHIYKTVSVVAVARITPGADLRAEYDRACGEVDALVAKLARPPGVGGAFPPADLDSARPPSPRGVLPSRYESNFAPGEFQAKVRVAKEYIHAGDAFQIVLSQRFRTTTSAAPFSIYRALRVVNPSPFLFYLEAGSSTLIGASPEILCRVENGAMTVRPLAGSRPRGLTPEEDARLAAELVADPKERAEHIMLVDLARNDVGTVCELGSVRVSDLLSVERYSHIMHLSSTVSGKLKAGATPFDAMRASLPAGTLSGAPKVRAMEIIDELEPHRRGPYGGAVGYFDFSGNTDTCIALRTLVLCGTTADIQAGAGIVADSDPQAEYEETVNKAMSLIRAIEVAEGQLS